MASETLPGAKRTGLVAQKFRGGDSPPPAVIYQGKHRVQQEELKARGGGARQAVVSMTDEESLHSYVPLTIFSLYSVILSSATRIKAGRQVGDIQDQISSINATV